MQSFPEVSGQCCLAGGNSNARRQESPASALEGLVREQRPADGASHPVPGCPRADAPSLESFLCPECATIQDTKMISWKI